MPVGWFSLGGDALLLTVSLAALAVGGVRERIAGLAFLAAGALTLSIYPLTHRYAAPQLFFLIDLGVMAVLVGLAWRARRRWPLAAVGFQGVALATHVIRFVKPAMPGWTYVSVLSLTSDAALAALALGTWSAWRRHEAKA